MPDTQGLKLNISEADNAMDLDLVLSVAPYFRVPAKTADDIIKRIQSFVRQWQTIAEHLKIPKREQDRMAPAFRLTVQS